MLEIELKQQTKLTVTNSVVITTKNIHNVVKE